MGPGELIRAAVLALVVAPALLHPPAAAQSTTTNAKVSASVVKPLVLTRVQDLDLGTILLRPGTWSGATVALSRTGVRTCSNPNLTCSGAPQTARFTVAGTNNRTVTITVSPVTLVNQSDPGKTLTLTVDSPGTVTLGNSGAKGVPFDLGGSIPLSSSTADGVYSGTMNVTVNY